MKNKVDAIYARQSVDKADSISVESQIEACMRETDGKNYATFSDKGFSGKNTDRPQFQQMMESIRRGEIKRVICYKLDRVSRSILDFTVLTEEFRKYNVEFVSHTEKFDTGEPIGRAMLSICAVFAQMEREAIQQRVTDAYRARSQKGFYMGGKIPFGYRKEPYMIDGKKTSHYVVNEEEARILRMIYDMYAEPQTSLGDVARFLIENGYQNPRGRAWDRTRIGEMIKNPIYVKADIDAYHFFQVQGAVLHDAPADFAGTNGCYLYSDEKGGRKTITLKNHHIVIAPHEGLIPSDIWLKVRKKCLNNKQSAKPIKAKNTWLAGKAKCGKCGYALNAKVSPNKRRKYYMCSRHLQALTACEGIGGIDLIALEDVVLEAMNKHLQEFKTLSSAGHKIENPKINELKAKIAQLQTDIDGFVDKLSGANESLFAYINDRVEKLDTEKKKLQGTLLELEMADADRCDVMKITNYMDKWNDLSMADKITVVDALISVIKVTEDDVDIVWKI